MFVPPVVCPSLPLSSELSVTDYTVVCGKSVDKTGQVRLLVLSKSFLVPSHLVKVFNKHSELFGTYYSLMCLQRGERSSPPLGDGRQEGSDVLM